VVPFSSTKLLEYALDPSTSGMQLSHGSPLMTRISPGFEIADGADTLGLGAGGTRAPMKDAFTKNKIMQMRYYVLDVF
jgi:hypothetical protein